MQRALEAMRLRAEPLGVEEALLLLRGVRKLQVNQHRDVIRTEYLYVYPYLFYNVYILYLHIYVYISVYICIYICIYMYSYRNTSTYSYIHREIHL